MALTMLSVIAVGAPAAQANHRDDTMATDAHCALTPNQVAGSAALAGENGVNSVLQDTNNGFAWDFPTPQLMDTDPGHFNFRGTATCTGLDEAAEGPAPAGPPNAAGPQALPPGDYQIIASGDFDNLICGTGTANGDAVIKGPLPFIDNGANPPAVQIFTEFAIEFVGGAGGGPHPKFKGKLVFGVDADETGVNNGGGQLDTAPDGAETWAGSDMSGLPGVNDYTANGGHSYAVIASNGNQIDGGGGTGDVTITPNETVPGSGNCVNENVTQFLVNGEFGGFLSGEGSTVSQPKVGQVGLDSDN
jgi:hypothetical protein